jgi:iron complex outermembrane receptor protein
LFREDKEWYRRDEGFFIQSPDDTAKYQPGIYLPWNYYDGHNYHLTDIYGAKFSSTFTTIAGETSLGFDFRSENIWSNVLGNPMEDTISAVNESHGFYDKKYSRTIMDYYLEQNLYLGDVSVSAGLVGSWSNEFSLGWKIYPGIDLSYRFARGWKVYGTYNRSLRLPTFTDLFYSGPSNTGNPDLKPEKVNSYEGGLKMSYPGITGYMAGFVYDADNIIAWTRPSGNVDQWKTKNLTELISRGVEFSLTAYPRRIFDADMPLKGIGVDYTFIDQEKITDGFESKYSLNYLNHNLGINLSAGWRQWSFSIVSSYTDREGRYLKYNSAKNQYTSEVKYKPVWVIDGKASYRLSRWEIYLNVSNLFNNRHYDIGNVKTPGRWIKFGVEKRFGLGD